MAQQASFSSSSSSSSSSSFSYAWSFDVFLNFRGTDTRFGFTGYLYKALCDRGIRTFIDDEELQKGDEITPTLIKAIQESRIAVLVFSKNYASSSFCLDELVTIMECVKGNGRLVLPVFYDVDPSDVRHQRGTYGEALARHEGKFEENMEKVRNWRKALHQAANLSGETLKIGDGYEHEIVGKIVDAISRKIGRVALPVADYPIGLESQVLKVTSLLDVRSNDGVHMVGVHGIGGIGKTALARAVYNLIADHFEGLCFLENVRENSNKKGLVYLQNLLLSEVLGENKIELASVQQGISKMQCRLQQKKVLLILDDVDKQEQLHAIVGRPDWFGSGSKVIITTRDKHLLKCHGIERTYEVEGLQHEEALELLSWKAFKTVNVDPSYTDVLNRAVTYACGLPLALEVIGSNLSRKSVEHWKSALDQYERIPNKKIQKILKVSFDVLEEDEQNVFLDIACCFKGYALTEVEDILCAHYGSCMKYHIGVLVEKSLIKISQTGKLTLHDLIEDMGKEIVRLESPAVPGKRSRLWFYEDIVQVLEDNQGTCQIEIIHLDFPSFEEEEEEEEERKEDGEEEAEEKVKVKWNGKAFKKMKNLKTLIIKNGHFLKSPKYLPNSLRVLEWWKYPSQYLPSNFYPKNLSIFKFPNNFFMSLELASLLKKFVNLKVLNFDDTECLRQIPDISGLPNLEKLSFEYCENLITVHNSVGSLDKLTFLSAYSCPKLKSFPPIKLPSLEELHLSYCRSLESFPEIQAKMENVTQLELEFTRIKDLPLSFQSLSQLQKLSLICNESCRIPSVIVMMPALVEIAIRTCDEESLSLEQHEVEETVNTMGSSNVERLCLSSCKLLDEFFPLGLALFANVKELDLSCNFFAILPECIKECRLLRKLIVDYCWDLREIRGIPPNLEHFSAINCLSWTSSCSTVLLNQELHDAGNTLFTLPAASIPEWFEHQSRGASISFWFRKKFPAIALCVAFKHPVQVFFDPTVYINGNKRSLGCGEQIFRIIRDHIILFDLQMIKLEDNLDEAFSEDEWNHVEVSYMVSNDHRAKESGMHIFKQKSNMEDIQFTNPYKRIKLYDAL